MQRICEETSRGNFGYAKIDTRFYRFPRAAASLHHFPNSRARATDVRWISGERTIIRTTRAAGATLHIRRTP